MATKKKEAESVDLAAMLQSGDLDVSTLNDLLAKAGLKAVAQGISEKKMSRTEKRSQWATAKKSGLDEEEQATVESLPKVLGSAPVMLAEDDVRDLTQAEIDSIMSEELARRETEDIIKGRYDAIRATVMNLVSHRNGDDQFATGEVASLKHGYKFVVGVSERGGTPDYAALQGLVDEKVWESITDEVTTRTINEEKLTAALTAGKITLEQFQQVIPQKQLIRNFTVKQLKEGDEVK